ncbi:MAG: ASCH domain-containing protein [Candidatus Bathyarchaeia archaeon]
MVLFKRPLLSLILQGRKTQTRRIHKYELTVGRTYGIRSTWFEKPKAHIRITRKFRQRLGDITETEIRKEGFDSLENFKQAWKAIHGDWNPEQTVIAYEFELVS